MFEQRDYMSFSDTVKEQFYLSACDYWAGQGFLVTKVSDNRIQGESYDSKVGLKRSFILTLNDTNGITHLDLQLRANVTDLGIVGGVAAVFICWPIAIIGGAWSYNEYKKDAEYLKYHFWNYMSQIARGEGSTNRSPFTGSN